MPLTKILLGVILVLTVASGFLFWRTIQGAKTVAAMKVERAVLEQSINTLQENTAKVDQALLESRQARDKLEKRSREWEQRYSDVLRSDEKARVWADGAVPNSVIELLRDHPDSDKVDSPAGSAPGNGAVAGVQRGDKR